LEIQLEAITPRWKVKTLGWQSVT